MLIYDIFCRVASQSSNQRTYFPYPSTPGKKTVCSMMSSMCTCMPKTINWLTVDWELVHQNLSIWDTQFYELVISSKCTQHSLFASISASWMTNTFYFCVASVWIGAFPYYTTRNPSRIGMCWWKRCVFNDCRCSACHMNDCFFTSFFLSMLCIFGVYANKTENRMIRGGNGVKIRYDGICEFRIRWTKGSYYDSDWSIVYEILLLDLLDHGLIHNYTGRWMLGWA